MKISKTMVAAVGLAAGLFLSVGAASAATVYKGYNFGEIKNSGQFNYFTYVTKGGPYVFTFAFRLIPNMDVSLQSTIAAPFTVELMQYPTSCVGYCVGGAQVAGAGGSFGAGTSATPTTFALGYTSGIGQGVEKVLAGRYYYEVMTNAPVGTSGRAHFTLMETLNATAVPEPSIWVIMLMGIGAVGAALRASRRANGAASAVA